MYSETAPEVIIDFYFGIGLTVNADNKITKTNVMIIYHI